MAKRKDGQEVRQDNLIQVLETIKRFGYCTTSTIATATRKSVRSVQRTIKFAKKERLIVETTAPDGRRLVALGRGGAAVVDAKKIDLRGVTWSHWKHRDDSNTIAAKLIESGCEVITEHEIQRDKIGVKGKVPDLIAEVELEPGRGKQWCWIEVEQSRKSPRDIAKIQKLLSSNEHDYRQFQCAGKEVITVIAARSMGTAKRTAKQLKPEPFMIWITQKDEIAIQ